MTLTVRQLIEQLAGVPAEHMDDEVIVRVQDDDSTTLVGGLTQIALDAGCTEIVALVLDGETTAESRYTRSEHQYGIGETDDAEDSEVAP